MAAKQEEFAEKLAEQEQSLKQETLALKQWRTKLQSSRAKFVADHPDGMAFSSRFPREDLLCALRCKDDVPVLN